VRDILVFTFFHDKTSLRLSLLPSHLKPRRLRMLRKLFGAAAIAIALPAVASAQAIIADGDVLLGVL
jgi:hypothetical protein